MQQYFQQDYGLQSTGLQGTNIFLESEAALCLQIRLGFSSRRWPAVPRRLSSARYWWKTPWIHTEPLWGGCWCSGALSCKPYLLTREWRRALEGWWPPGSPPQYSPAATEAYPPYSFGCTHHTWHSYEIDNTVTCTCTLLQTYTQELIREGGHPEIPPWLAHPPPENCQVLY